MHQRSILPILCVVISLFPITLQAAQGETPCSGNWQRYVEANLPSGDGAGHGPDLGSVEWQSVIEFHLGVRGDGSLPSKESEAWCHYIDRALTEALYPDNATAPGPAFDCGTVETGSIEAMICQSPALAAQDRTLNNLYHAARNKAHNEHPPRLAAEQRGWIKGRDACWKSNDPTDCVTRSYRRRTAELQAHYRLVPFGAPHRFLCADNDADEVIITHFDTQPPTLIAERGDQVSLMFHQPSASGSHYQGRNESFWEHSSPDPHSPTEATVTWGYEAKPMRCRRDMSVNSGF
ncbi:MliC family protein [Ferrimonas gelatinilytica]|uniref:MliC family protein n=1 Tax=Ferrimonas gelatinilytica TaxID=1255257 RepID=A0ABP9RXG6_9GAMM